MKHHHIVKALALAALFLRAGSAQEEPAVEYKAYLGLQQSQASASDRTWKLFGNLGTNVQVTRWSRFLVDLDLTSVPQQVGFNVSQVTTQGPALVKNLPVNEAVQSVNLLVGGEFGNIRGPASVLAIKGLLLGGFSTPLSPKESVQVYNSTQDAFNQLGIKASATTYPYLALTTPDRSRFYGQYYAGFRLKLLKGMPADDGNSSNAPGYFDITFGQNAAVTGGQLRRFVWRFAGFLPIPKTPFAIVGTSYSALSRNENSQPLFLAPVATPVTLPNPQTYVFAKAENRDFYQVGVSMDLVAVMKNYLPNLVKSLTK
jgi:hypothetical protein